MENGGREELGNGTAGSVFLVGPSPLIFWGTLGLTKLQVKQADSVSCSQLATNRRPEGMGETTENETGRQSKAVSFGDAERWLDEGRANEPILDKTS